MNDKYGFVLCGFDTRGTVTEIDHSTGKERARDIKPHELSGIDMNRF